MESKPISPLIEQTAFEAPIPGQSLTNSPENNYAWEKPPEMVDLNVATRPTNRGGRGTGKQPGR